MNVPFAGFGIKLLYWFCCWFHWWKHGSDKNPAGYIILDNRVFENFALAICKSFTNFWNCVLVNNNLWEKLVSWWPLIFDKGFKDTLVPYFYSWF